MACGRFNEQQLQMRVESAKFSLPRSQTSEQTVGNVVSPVSSVALVKQMTQLPMTEAPGERCRQLHDFALANIRTSQ